MTKPVEDLLPLPLDTQVQPYMNFYHDVLHELVCFGTHILKWSLEQHKGKAYLRNETDMAVPLLFRHILEMIDAISVQVKAGIAVPCKVQLRVFLEAYLSLEYMLEKDRSRRAASFMVVDHYRKLSLFKKLAPGTAENDKFMSEIKQSGRFMSNFTPVEQALHLIKNQEDLIALPIYKDVREEYLKVLKKKPKAEIKWYSLFEGPSSVVWLATRLNKLDLYEFFYKSWSNTTHSTDLSTKVLVRGNDGQGAITQLRNMEEMHEVVTQAMTLTLMLFTELMTKKVISEKQKEIGEWYFSYRATYRDPLESRKINFI